MKTPTLFTIFFFVFFEIFAQSTVEFTASAGATVIDIEHLVEIDEIEGTWAEDWGTFNSGLGGQYVHGINNKIGLGVELMYQSLYWYSVSVPYVSQRIYREYYVSTVRFTPLIRFGVNDQFAFDIGPEFNFMDEVTLGFLVSSNYYIPITDKVMIPLKVRSDFIFGTVTTIPISFNTGLRFTL